MGGPSRVSLPLIALSGMIIIGCISLSRALDCYSCNTGESTDPACDTEPVLINSTTSDCDGDGWKMLSDVNLTLHAFRERIATIPNDGKHVHNSRRRRQADENNNTATEEKQTLCFSYSYTGYQPCAHSKGRSCRPLPGDSLVHRGCLTDSEFQLLVVIKGALDASVDRNSKVVNQCFYSYECYEKEKTVVQVKTCFCNTDLCNSEDNVELSPGTSSKCNIWKSSARAVTNICHGLMIALISVVIIL